MLAAMADDALLAGLLAPQVLGQRSYLVLKLRLLLAALGALNVGQSSPLLLLLAELCQVDCNIYLLHSPAWQHFSQQLDVLRTHLHQLLVIKVEPGVVQLRLCS